MATKRTFAFKLDQPVKLRDSDETGHVIGRAHYVDSNPQYQIRYKAGDGRVVESWWYETAIEAVS